MKRTVSFGARTASVSFVQEQPIEVPPLPGGAGTWIDHKPTWAGHYSIETHNRSAIEILAEINRLQLFHEKRVARLTGFATLVAAPFTVDGEPIAWSTCTIRRRGTDVELRARVKDASGRFFEIHQVYSSIDDVPKDIDIVRMFTTMIRDRRSADAAQAAKIAEVEVQLGRGGQG